MVIVVELRDFANDALSREGKSAREVASIADLASEVAPSATVNDERLPGELCSFFLRQPSNQLAEINSAGRTKEHQRTSKFRSTKVEMTIRSSIDVDWQAESGYYPAQMELTPRAVVANITHQQGGTHNALHYSESPADVVQPPIHPNNVEGAASAVAGNARPPAQQRMMPKAQ